MNNEEFIITDKFNKGINLQLIYDAKISQNSRNVRRGKSQKFYTSEEMTQTIKDLQFKNQKLEQQNVQQQQQNEILKKTIQQLESHFEQQKQNHQNYIQKQKKKKGELKKFNEEKEKQLLQLQNQHNKIIEKLEQKANMQQPIIKQSLPLTDNLNNPSRNSEIFYLNNKIESLEEKVKQLEKKLENKRNKIKSLKQNSSYLFINQAQLNSYRQNQQRNILPQIQQVQRQYQLNSSQITFTQQQLQNKIQDLELELSFKNNQIEELKKDNYQLKLKLEQYN